MARQQASLTFAQLEKLWQQAGGSASSAPVAAAIALAESSGNPGALNNNPATGDYSVGLWQINYFGSLAPGRTAQFGPPQALTNPLANAKAAVAISNGGTDFGAWSTYTHGTYQNYLDGGGAPSLYQQPARPGGTAPASFTSSITSDAENAIEGPGSLFASLLGGATDLGGAVKFFGWLLRPQHWAQIFETLLGTALVILGFVRLGKGDDGPDVSLRGAVGMLPGVKATEKVGV